MGNYARRTDKETATTHESAKDIRMKKIRQKLTSLTIKLEEINQKMLVKKETLKRYLNKFVQQNKIGNMKMTKENSINNNAQGQINSWMQRKKKSFE